jgi:hypothetical protein
MLCLLTVGRRKKKKRERNSQGLFSQGQNLDTPCWLCHEGFLRLLGVIKG